MTLRYPVLLGAAALVLTSTADAQTRRPSRDDLLDALTRHIQICTEISDSQARLSCYDKLQTQVGDVDGAHITTIEGLSPDGKHPVQQAWLAEDVPQCGYCQSGQIMAAAAFLAANPKPTDADIDANLSNICRCGTYVRIRAAIHAAASA